MSEQLAIRTEAVYSGVSFVVWKGQGTWFWSLVRPYRQGGTIGAAASKAEAMREAQFAIEHPGVTDGVE